ncbi:MAG: hypothetical protein L3J46_11825, partial [Kangiellaceae bacterium]|nr:hypothetical protein [Kangiellaceae bacterium]
AYSLIKEDVTYSFNQRMDCVNDIFREMSATDDRVNTIELAKFICPSHFCRIKIEGVILRYDGLHYAGEGAQLVYLWMTSQISKKVLSDKNMRLIEN